MRRNSEGVSFFFFFSLGFVFFFLAHVKSLGIACFLFCFVSVPFDGCLVFFLFSFFFICCGGCRSGEGQGKWEGEKEVGRKIGGSIWRFCARGGRGSLGFSFLISFRFFVCTRTWGRKCERVRGE